MKTLTLNIPDTVDLDSKEVTMILAARLYEQGKLSLGQAADLVGLSKQTFAEMLGRCGVSLFNYPSSELSNDVANA
jgi:predicted HTH domain antitoxin